MCCVCVSVCVRVCVCVCVCVCVVDMKDDGSMRCIGHRHYSARKLCAY